MIQIPIYSQRGQIHADTVVFDDDTGIPPEVAAIVIPQFFGPPRPAARGDNGG